MPLDYAEFAHHYRGDSQSDEARRTHFEAVADFLECVVRLWWQNRDGPNTLGITLDGGALSVRDGLDSKDKLTTAFTRTALPAEARKKEP